MHQITGARFFVSGWIRWLSLRVDREIIGPEYTARRHVCPQRTNAGVRNLAPGAFGVALLSASKFRMVTVCVAVCELS